jgi:hypothetical protein
MREKGCAKTGVKEIVPLIRKIDRTAMKIYEQYGLKISEKKGTVKNIHRYRELLEEIDGIKTY